MPEPVPSASKSGVLRNFYLPQTIIGMTWVKICGMTNLEDALTAVDAGADAVGFVFYEKSPRNISVENAREIVAKLPESVEKVGVFVHGCKQDAARVFLEAGLTGMQTYFSVETVESSGQGGTLEASLLPKRCSARMWNRFR
jgi:phosphoribosylanthranilate isomerase